MGSHTEDCLHRIIRKGAFVAVLLLALLNEVCMGQQRGRSRAGVGLAVAAGAANGGQLVDFDCPEEFGYYPHPTDCTQYYVCVFGGALLESCTGGLMYSHELQTCDWPRNVGCGAEESATISTVRVTDPRTRQTTASGASVRTAPISRGQQQREQQQRQQQDEIAKHQLYADDLGPAEEVETDRQQRVYRGQPSTVGQVARDRDGLRHQVTNAIPAPSGRVASGDKVSVISFGTGHQQQQQTQQYSFDELILDENSLLTNVTLHHGRRKKRQVKYRFQGQSGPVFQLIHSGLNEFSSVTVPVSNNEANYNNYQNLRPSNGNNNFPIPIPAPALRPSNPSSPPSFDNDFQPIINPGVPNKELRNFQSPENYHTSGQRPPPNIPYTKTNNNFKIRPPQTQNPLASPDNVRQLLQQSPSSPKPNPSFASANVGGPSSYTNFQQNTGVVILPNSPSGTPQSFFNQQVLHGQQQSSSVRLLPSTNQNQFISRDPGTTYQNHPVDADNYSYLLIQKPNEDSGAFLTRTTENPFHSPSQQQQQHQRQQQQKPQLSFASEPQTFPAGTGILQFSQDVFSLEEVHKHEQRATGHRHSTNPSMPPSATNNHKLDAIPSQYNPQEVQQTWQKLLREQQQSENWSPKAATQSAESISLLQSTPQTNANTEKKPHVFSSPHIAEHNNRVLLTQTQNENLFKPNIHPYGDNYNTDIHSQEPVAEFVVFSKNVNSQNKDTYVKVNHNPALEYRETFPEQSYVKTLNTQQTQQPFLNGENQRYVEKPKSGHYIQQELSQTVQNNDGSRSQLYRSLSPDVITKSASTSVPYEEYESVKLPAIQEEHRPTKPQEPSQQYEDYEDYEEEEDELEVHYNYKNRPYYDEQNSEEVPKSFHSSQNTRTQELPTNNSPVGRVQTSALKYKNKEEGLDDNQYTNQNKNKSPLQQPQFSQVAAEEQDETKYKALSLGDSNKKSLKITTQSTPVEITTEDHFPSPPMEFFEDIKYHNIHNPFANPDFDFDKFIDQIRDEPKTAQKAGTTATFNEDSRRPQLDHYHQPQNYIKSTTSRSIESSTIVPVSISPRIVRTRQRTQSPIHIDLSRRRIPTTTMTTATTASTVTKITLSPITTTSKQTADNLREHFAPQNMKSENTDSSLVENSPIVPLSITNYQSFVKDDTVTTTTIKTTSYSPVPIVITNHQLADGKPDPLTVPFYHGEDGNFYAHPVHTDIMEIHTAAPEGEKYFKYSVDNGSPSSNSEKQIASNSANSTTDTVYYIIDSSNNKHSSTASPVLAVVSNTENSTSSFKKPQSSDTSRNPRRRLPTRAPFLKSRGLHNTQTQNSEKFGSTNNGQSGKNSALHLDEETQTPSTTASSFGLSISVHPHPFTVSREGPDGKILKVLEAHSSESTMPKPFTEETLQQVTILSEENIYSLTKDPNKQDELTSYSIKPQRSNEGRKQVKLRHNVVTTSAVPTEISMTSTAYIPLERNKNRNSGKVQDNDRAQSTQHKKPSSGIFAYSEPKNASQFQDVTEVITLPFQRGNQGFEYSERPNIQTSTVTANELLQSVYDIANIMYKQPQFGLSPNNRPQTGVLATSAVINTHSDIINSKKTQQSTLHRSPILKLKDSQLSNINSTAPPANNQSLWQQNSQKHQDNKSLAPQTVAINDGSQYTSVNLTTYAHRNHTRRRPTSPNLLVRHRVRRPYATPTSPSTFSITTTLLPSNDIDTTVTLKTTFKQPTPQPSQIRATHTTPLRRQNRRPIKTTTATSTTAGFTDKNRSILLDRPQLDERLLNRKPPAPLPETVNKGEYSISAAISTATTRVEPSNPPVTYVQQAPAPSPNVYNSSQRYDPSQYDPYYNLYDDEVELYKDVADYGQFPSSQQTGRQTTTQQQQYRGQSPYKQVPQPPPQEQRNAAYAQPSYNTQQDVYSQNVDAQDYNENYNSAADDQGQYGQQAGRQAVRSDRNELNFASQRPSTTSTSFPTTTATSTTTTIRSTTALPSTTTATVALERQQTRLRAEPYTNTNNYAAANNSPRARVSTTTKSTPFPADFDTPYILTLQTPKPTRQTPSNLHDTPQSRTITLTTAFSLLDPFSTEQSKPSKTGSRGQTSHRISIEPFGGSNGRQNSQRVTLGIPLSRTSSRTQGGINNSRKAATSASFIVDSKNSSLQGFSLEDEVIAIENSFNSQQNQKQGNEVQSRPRNVPQYNRNQENRRGISSEPTVQRSRSTLSVSPHRLLQPDAEFTQITTQSRQPSETSSLSSTFVSDSRNSPHSRRPVESLSNKSGSDHIRMRKPTEEPSALATSRNYLEFSLNSAGTVPVRAASQSRKSNEPSPISFQTATPSRHPTEAPLSLNLAPKQRSFPSQNNADHEDFPKSRVSNPESESQRESTPSSVKSSYRASLIEADDVQSGLAHNSIELQSEVPSNTRSRQRGSIQRKSSTHCNDAIDTNANSGCDESPSHIRVRPTTATPDSQSTPTPARGNNGGRTRGSNSYTTGTGGEQTVNRGTPASVSRSRPTLKPSTAIVSKAQEYIDIYKYPAKRPDPVYPTPQVDKTAAKCRKDVCLLPDCYCGGKDIPGDFAAEEIPQLVLLTFDDSANDLNKGLYQDLFENGRTNPNGCPISATFYVSHEWTDYSHVQNLYATGHEIASHSISHSFGEQFSQKKWTKEIAGQREILAAYGGVRMEDIRGMRAPFLAIGGNKMFKMLYDSNFTYDSSMPVYENRPPSWPYTLDYKIFHDCMIPPCPTRSYPGVWEVPMVMWQDLNGGRCSMGDACSNPPTADGVYKMLIKNFERHYTTNRAPFGLFYHAAWFTQPHHKEGFIAFLDTIVNMQDVWLVTNWQAIQWVRDPTPLSRIKNFPPFQCNYPERPRKCNNPKVCNVWHKSGVRYMRTCQPCPEVYPWTGKTGVRNSRVDNEIIEE